MGFFQLTMGSFPYTVRSANTEPHLLTTLPAATPIVIVPNRPGSQPCRLTWAEFCADNADAFTPGELAEIAAEISQPFRSYPLAGGAAPQFFVALDRRS